MKHCLLLANESLVFHICQLVRPSNKGCCAAARKAVCNFMQYSNMMEILE